MLYAANRHAILMIFQAMDAAGKDGAIRHVMSGINPQGCQVFSFKHPSAEELQHDFLWRSTQDLPERGRIGIFNRSYYEEVLILRVHPELLAAEALAGPGRRRSRVLANALPLDHRSGTASAHQRHPHRQDLPAPLEGRAAQTLSSTASDDPQKNWKFSTDDIKERGFWNAYRSAYEDCVGATSTADVPWHVVPADDKHTARLIVSQILLDTSTAWGRPTRPSPPSGRRNCRRSARPWRNEGGAGPRRANRCGSPGKVSSGGPGALIHVAAPARRGLL